MIMRFTSEDTYRGNPEDPLSLNYYTYAHGNPLRYVDPDGHSIKDIWNKVKETTQKVNDTLYDFFDGVSHSIQSGIMATAGIPIIWTSTVQGMMGKTDAYNYFDYIADAQNLIYSTSSTGPNFDSKAYLNGREVGNWAFVGLSSWIINNLDSNTDKVPEQINKADFYGTSDGTTFTPSQYNYMIQNNLTIQEMQAMFNNVKDMYQKYDANGWKGNITGQTSGTKAGGKFENAEGLLPSKDVNNNPITYREFDVNNKNEGLPRDMERFIQGNDGSVYYTPNHYETFIKMK